MIFDVLAIYQGTEFLHPVQAEAAPQVDEEVAAEEIVAAVIDEMPLPTEEEAAEPVADEEAEPEIEIEVTVEKEQAETEPEKGSSSIISSRVREIADQFADILGTVLEKAKPEQSLSLTLENSDGRQLSYVALINKVHTVAPDATQAFIKPSENKIYYVTPNSAGSIDLF